MVKKQPKKTPRFDFFRGRVSRLQFFFGFFYILLLFTADVMVGGLNAHIFKHGPVYTGIAYVTSIIALLILLFVLFQIASLYTRRLHDLGRSGLLALIVLIPGPDILLMLFLQFMPGEKEANPNGDPPSDRLDAMTIWGFRP